MVDGPRGPPHPEADLGPLKGGPRRRGTGQTALPVPQDHLAVGADVDEQGQLLPPVEGGGDHAPHRVRPHEARNIGQHPDCRPGTGRQPIRLRQLHGLPHQGHIGGLYQGTYVQTQQQVVHGGVAHQAHQADLLRIDARRLCRLPGQAVQAGADLRPHPPVPVLHLVLNPGDDIGAIGALGIHRAGAGELPPRPPVAEEGHHRGGPHVEGQRIGAPPVGAGAPAARQDLDLLPLRQLHGHVLRDLILAGRLRPPVHQHPALSAGPLSAAGGVQRESLLPQDLQQPRPLRSGEPLPGGFQGNKNLLHTPSQLTILTK